MNRSLIRLLGGIVLLGVLLSGCMSNPSTSQPTTVPATPVPATSVAAPSPLPTKPSTVPTAAPARATAVPAQPTVVPVPSAPTFGFTPQSGGPGTRVRLDGWNFAVGKPIVVRLGMPNPIGEVLVSAMVDAQGRWNAELVLPDRLPSGDLITARSLNLIVMNDANQALAAAPFAFTPAGNPIPPREAASQVVRDLLHAYVNGGDVGVYLSADLRARLLNGESIDQLLGLSPNTLQSFDVGAPLNRPADALFIPAQLTYTDLQEAREFTVVLEHNAWKVAGSSTPRGEQPAPTPDGQEIRTALTADLNGDGQPETITYRTGRVKITTPTGFSDPSIVAVVIAQELFVTQGPVPGGRTLLYLNPVALNSEQGRLLLMGQQNEPNPGFLVVVYGGANHSYYITPIASDGTPGGQSVRAVWSATANAYVLG